MIFALAPGHIGKRRAPPAATGGINGTDVALWSVRLSERKQIHSVLLSDALGNPRDHCGRMRTGSRKAYVFLGVRHVTESLIQNDGVHRQRQNDINELQIPVENTFKILPQTQPLGKLFQQPDMAVQAVPVHFYVGGTPWTSVRRQSFQSCQLPVLRKHKLLSFLRRQQQKPRVRLELLFIIQLPPVTTDLLSDILTLDGICRCISIFANLVCHHAIRCLGVDRASSAQFYPFISTYNFL